MSRYEEIKRRLEQETGGRRTYCRRCNSFYLLFKSGDLCPDCHGILIYEDEQIPECPTCHSKNIESVSQTRRSLNRFAFGINNPTARAQFECKNCGYKW